MAYEEYGPIRWESLTESQQDGAQELAARLMEALHGSTRLRAEEGQQVAFVSGRRGCGKTTLLRMMREMLASRKLDRYLRLRPSVEELLNARQNVTWLEPIPLDPLPDGANLVAAIFSRLSDSNRMSRREVTSNTGVLDVSSDFDRARNELNALQTKAVLALEGNAVERRPNVDQDTFAINALENERTRPALQTKLTQILNRILDTRGGHGAEGIFVIVIDDIDVRPSRAVEALQLVSLLAIPRLFFVFSGILETVDQLLLYRTQQEFLGALGEGVKDHFILSDVQGRANEIASSLLRKLVPPDRRIVVKPMSVRDAWCKGWSKDTDKNDVSIKSLVEGQHGHKDPLLVPIKWTRLSLDDLIRPQPEKDEAKKAWCHPGSEQVLVAPQRQLTGLYRCLHDKCKVEGAPKSEGASQGEGAAKVEGAPKVEMLNDAHYESMRGRLWTLFEAVVDEDPGLGIPAQRHLKAMFRGGESGGLAVLGMQGLETSVVTGLRVDCDVVRKNDAPKQEKTKKGKTVKASYALHSKVEVAEITRRQITVAVGDEWRTSGESKESDRPKSIGSEAAAMLMLFHDFCALHDRSRVIGTLDWNKDSRVLLAQSKIGDKAHAWYCMTWPTYRLEQRFLHGWNAVVVLVSQVVRDASGVKGNQIAVLLGLGFCAAVIEAARDVLRKLVPGSIKDWMCTDLTTHLLQKPEDSPWSLRDGVDLGTLIDDGLRTLNQNLATALKTKLKDGEEDHDFALGFDVYVQLDRLLDEAWSPLHKGIPKGSDAELDVSARLDARKKDQAARLSVPTTAEKKVA